VKTARRFGSLAGSFPRPAKSRRKSPGGSQNRSLGRKSVYAFVGSQRFHTASTRSGHSKPECAAQSGRHHDGEGVLAVAASLQTLTNREGAIQNFGCRLSGAKDRVAVVSITGGLSSACRPGRQGEAAWFGAKETRRPRDRETASSGADHPALPQLYEHLRSAPSTGSSDSSFGPERAPPCRPAVMSIGLVCTLQTALVLA
jgi:hypothetical protein